MGKLIKIALTIAVAVALFASFAEAWRRRRRRRDPGKHDTYYEIYCKQACGPEKEKYENCVCQKEVSECFCTKQLINETENIWEGVGTGIPVNWWFDYESKSPNENSPNGNSVKQDFAGDNKENIPCDWTWSECSATCGAGVQKSVVLWKSDDDTSCDPPKEKPCNLKPCE